MKAPQVPAAEQRPQPAEILERVHSHFQRFVCVTDPLDHALLTLWAAHTHVALETYTTPRLILDSTMPGSGKTTVLEHLQRLCLAPVQAAALSSSALLPRMLEHGPRTLLIDEVDRTLDPKKPETGELLAILNSGYKRGGTRPVLVPSGGNKFAVNEMPTFAPVVMAGNTPHLPDDTRSRAIRVLLMPDRHGTVEWSDWEEIEPEVLELGIDLAGLMDELRDTVRDLRPDLPEKCVARLAEKWRPLMRVAAAVGGRWPVMCAALIERDIEQVEAELEDGLTKLPPVVILLEDLHEIWPHTVTFMSSTELVGRLVEQHPDYWGDQSPYGRRLTVQRLGRILVESLKVRSTKSPQDVRGYNRWQFETGWKQHGIATARTPPTDSEPF